MIQAFIVYFSLLFLMVFFASKGKFVFLQGSSNVNRSNNYIKISFVSIFIFSLVIGLRYYVGGDYGGYLDDFNNFNLKISYFDTRYEFGYYLLMVILKTFSLSYPFLFIGISFLQIFFVYKWASKYRYLLPWVIYFYFTTLYLFESMNIMRQALAFSILLYSTIYIQKSSKIKFIIMVLLATSFHKSAIFFLPFGFFVNKEWIKNKYIQLGLLALAFILSQVLFNTFFLRIKFFAEMLNYDAYSEQTTDLFVDNDIESIGIGLYFILTIDSLILLYSDELKRIFKNINYIVYHNMFFVGALLTAAFGGTNSIALGRFMFYFVSFRIVMLSFLCYYLFYIKNNKFNYLVGAVVIVAYLVWFVSAILKGAAWCAPFNFVFQDFVPSR
jgi:hypothetical protein